MEGSGDSSSGNNEEGISWSSKTCFPPAATWYKTNAIAARDDMLAYLAGQSIVLVKPKVTYPKATSDGVNNTRSLTESDVWPNFHVFGYQREMYACLSFCQSAKDFLPVKSSPLVTGCKEGYVRIWNVDTGSCIMYHDLHKEGKNVPVSCVDWSIRNPKVIYSMDEEGTLISWYISKMKLKAFSCGKITPSSLHASPHEDNIVAFGTKGGTIFIVQTNPIGKGSVKILHKVRHDEEVVATLWCPKLGWRMNKTDGKVDEIEGAVLASSVHSAKAPTIRLWSRKAEDKGLYQVWRKEAGQGKIYKNFCPLLWAIDPNTGDPLLVTSSKRGDIVSYSNETVLTDMVHSLHGHNNIFGLVQCGDILWSTSYEPVIVGWDLRTMKVSCVIPTIKGVCAIAPSPSYGSFVGIGATDAVVRVVDFETNYPNKIAAKPPHLSLRMRCKVMALAWHPEKDTWLGFGTDDGVLGVYEVKDGNKYLLQFDRRVEGVVYAVDWGPSIRHKDQHVEVEKKEDENSEAPHRTHFQLFACGGNSVYVIHPSKKDNPLINVSKIIEKNNMNSTRLSGLSAGNTIPSKASDIRWSPDYSLFAVGYNDGRVELYSPPFLQLKCWIKCHARAIQYLSWRPHDFFQAKINPDHKDRWFVTTSNDGTARLFNLEGIFERKFLTETDESIKPKLIISSSATFKSPNGERIIACAWSPHDPDLLVTVSYDSTGIVWNVKDGIPISRYFGHGHRLVACCFHPKDQYKVITASDDMLIDCSVHVWDYRDHPFNDSIPASKKCIADFRPIHVKGKDQMVEEEMDDEEKPSLPEKKFAKDTSSHLHIADPTVVKFVPERHPKKKSKKKGAGSNSLLPASANRFINTKQTLEEEIRYLTNREEAAGTSNGRAKVNGNGESETTQKDESDSDDDDEECFTHLGLLGDYDQCVDLMKFECESHARKGNEEDWEKGCLLASWMGDTEFVEKAVAAGQVNETIVLLTKRMSKPLFVKACEVYAEKLVEKEEFSKAATYLLEAGLKEKAIQVLLDHKLYRDAVALMKISTTKNNSIQNDTLKAWLIQLVQDGNFEVAAKVYCSIGRFVDALAVIEKRDTPYAWKTGMFLASKAGDLQKLELLGFKFAMNSIMNFNHQEAKIAIAEYDDLKWLVPFVHTHEVIFHLSNKFRDAHAGAESQEVDASLKLLEEIDLGNAVKGQLDQLKLKAEIVITKLNEVILTSIAQCNADAEIILIRTLLLAILKDSQLNVSEVRENCLKLATTWLKEKFRFMYLAYEAAFLHLSTIVS